MLLLVQQQQQCAVVSCRGGFVCAPDMAGGGWISFHPGSGRPCFSQRFLRSCVTAADGGRSPFDAPLPRSSSPSVCFHALTLTLFHGRGST
jgi:hypothetical protein